MRLRNEINEKAESGVLASEVGDYARQYKQMLVPSLEVLADTVSVLSLLVSLSDKVLPLKSYFNVVQGIQRTAYLAAVLAMEMASDLPDGPEKEQFIDLESSRLRVVGAAGIMNMLTERLLAKDGLSAADTVGIEKTRQQIDQASHRRLCTEDVFMVACAYLDLEIAKQGSVHYLKGESPEFRETKKHRNPLALSDPLSLKSIASGLARPDEDRGAVERGQIESGFNRLVKLNALHMTTTAVVDWVKRMESSGQPACKVDVRKRFGLSHKDYERMMAMARRDGLIAMKNRRDPTNSYVLRGSHHARIVAIANDWGHTPQKALNKMLDDFLALIKLKSEIKT